MTRRLQLILILVLWLVPCQTVHAAPGDWTATLSTKSLIPYLQYPGSSIGQMVKVSALLGVEPANSNSGAATTQTEYENFYYTSGRAIGAERVSSLSLKSATAGIIRVISPEADSFSADETKAVANAALRMFVELFLHKCHVKMIVVPRKSLDAIVQAFCANGLQLLPPMKPEQPVQCRFFIEVQSDNGGQVRQLIM